MAEKIIKHRLFTWFEKTASLVKAGDTVLTERIAHLGDTVDITNPDYVERGELLGSFYTDEEAKAIKAGTYNGPDAALLYSRRGTTLPTGDTSKAKGTEDAGDVSAMDAPTLAEYLKENRLNVDKTVALADSGDAESIQKVLDAENIATGNDPRKGVVEQLESLLAAL